MTYSFKAFIISLLIHVSVFATIINFETFKEKKKEIIVLNMNMVNEITQIKKQTEKKQQTNTKEQKKQIEKKPKTIKKIQKPKKKKKIIKKVIKKVKPEKKIPKQIKDEIKPPKKEIKKELQKVEKNNTLKKDESKKRIKSGENYQQKYIKNNLAHIIAAIKKYKNYPYQAKKRGMEGRVIIWCIITKDGKLKDIKIMEKSEFDILNQNSIDILKKASREFEAPQKDVILTIPFNYYLN
ncbi:MAG: energy transducer TonB [Halarcobacter sp.]